MKLDFACRVDIGLRKTNDDRALVLNSVINQTAIHGVGEAPAVAAVCDGCGGYAGGGIAAETVLSIFLKEFDNNTNIQDTLPKILDDAILAVRNKKKEYPHYSEMCTTVAGCVFLDDSTVIFHAGDTRVYRYDGKNLARMTIDHSVVQNMVDMGVITEAEALSNPKRNIINRCIGMECPPPEIYISHTPISPGELYLICSDGFWESATDKEIIELLSNNLPLPKMVDLLVSFAKEHGSDDNITVCLCARQGKIKQEEETVFILD